MAFEFVIDGHKYKLIDRELKITITSKSTGGGMGRRRVFEFSGGGVVFCFWAQAQKDIGPDVWELNDHWMLDGVPRSDHINLLEIEIDPDKLAWAFDRIAEALPLFPIIEASRRKLGSVGFDLHGPGTTDPRKKST